MKLIGSIFEHQQRINKMLQDGTSLYLFLFLSWLYRIDKIKVTWFWYTQFWYNQIFSYERRKQYSKRRIWCIHSTASFYRMCYDCLFYKLQKRVSLHGSNIKKNKKLKIFLFVLPTMINKVTVWKKNLIWPLILEILIIFYFL